jgi:hypothetical protein
MLDLVDDDEATEPFQREEGVREPGEILVVLEVEVRDGIPPSGYHLPCERRLADLPGSEDPYDGHEIPVLTTDFSRSDSSARAAATGSLLKNLPSE